MVLQEQRNKVDVEELVIKAKEGDSHALGEVIERYRGFIMKQASRFRIPSYEYEDILQHGYLTVIRSVKLYKANSNKFDQYVMNAVKNNMGYLLRGNIKHFREIPDEKNENKTLLHCQLTLEDQIIAYDEIKKLYEAIETLSEEEKEIIKEFYFNKINMREYSETNNIKYHQLIVRKKKALKKLKKELNVAKK